MTIRVPLLIAACIALLAPTTASAADRLNFMPLDPDTFADSRNGVVRLLCADAASGHFYVSRAVLLDVTRPGSGHDVLLAARHGVSGVAGPRDCRVYGQDEETGRIIEMVLAPQDPGDDNEFGEDWAILRTAGRLPDGITRLHAAGAGTGVDGQLTMVNRVTDNQACRVERMENWADERLIVHTCPSRPGLSGSPMVTLIKGVPHVVGLHVGQYILLEEDGQRYGVARRLSDRFLDRLVAFIEPDTAQ